MDERPSPRVVSPDAVCGIDPRLVCARRHPGAVRPGGGRHAPLWAGRLSADEHGQGPQAAGSGRIAAAGPAAAPGAGQPGRPRTADPAGRRPTARRGPTFARNRLMVRTKLPSLFQIPTRAELRRALALSAITTAGFLVFPAIAAAQAVNIDLGNGQGLTERVVQLIGLMTVLSLAPSIVIMTTSFVRIVVVLSLLRTAMGLQQSPPNAVIVSLALFLTAIVMGPTFEASYNAGIKPLLDKQMELPAAFEAAGTSVKTFMLGQVDGEDLSLFIRLSKIPRPATAAETPIRVVTP